MNYLLKQLNKDQYYLVCMDYNSVLNYLDEVENEPLLQSNSGELVIDQLLVTGNGRNRFLTCQFSCGEIQLNTAKNIISKDTYKRISAEILKENINALKYSILSDSQIDLLRQGQFV